MVQLRAASFHKFPIIFNLAPWQPFFLFIYCLHTAIKCFQLQIKPANEENQPQCNESVRTKSGESKCFYIETKDIFKNKLNKTYCLELFNKIKSLIKLNIMLSYLIQKHTQGA